jgi:hypothetical protein|tara:strand:- start:380 stop:556 length:177 start_codon:yes stop_codon:yes gene_type:complete
MNVPELLKVRAGDNVLVGEDEIAIVISFVEEARAPCGPNFFKSRTLIHAKSNLFMLRK